MEVGFTLSVGDTRVLNKGKLIGRCSLEVVEAGPWIGPV